MIDIAFISTVGRLRQIDRKQVESLAESIAEVGLLNPITVYPKEIVRNGMPAQGYGLIAGAHRLEACKSLGWTEIPAAVVDLDDQRRVIAECDENLCGTNLSPAARAMFVEQRKKAYEALYPETINGANQHTRVPQNEEPSPDRFTKDTAKKTGKSEQTIQRDAKRGKVLGDRAQDIVNTSLDKGAEIDALAKLPPNERNELIDRAKAGEKVSARKPVAPPDPPLNSIEVSNKARQALMRAWNKASREDRDWFLAEIDRPVFDKTSAGGDR